MPLFWPLGTFCTLFFHYKVVQVPRAEKLRHFQGCDGIMGYSRKESNIKQGGWGHRIYAEIEEGIERRAYRNSMGSCHGPLVFNLGIFKRCHTN